MNQYIIELKIS